MRSTLDEVVAYLADGLDVHVDSTSPRERPDTYVVVAAVGGRSTLDALHPNYAIQAWSKSDDDARATLRDVCDLMRSYGATPFSDMVPLGNDGIYCWWQVTFTVHALW